MRLKHARLLYLVAFLSIIMPACITINLTQPPVKNITPPVKPKPVETEAKPALTGIITGRYLRTADTVLNGICTNELPSVGIQITRTRLNYFSAQYYNIDNNSRFEGRIYENGVVYIIQNDLNTNYTAIFCGHLTLNGNYIKGTFYDTRGNAGDFEWIQQNE